MHITRQNALESPERLLLRAEEVVRRLSLGRATVYLMMVSGQLPTVRIGRAVRVPAESLRQWVEKQTGATAQRLVPEQDRAKRQEMCARAAVAALAARWVKEKSNE